MKLTSEEEQMLSGKLGPGVQRSMDLLVRFGDIFGAEKMVKVNSVHMSMALPTELMEEMAEGVEKIRTFGSLHAVFDPKYWREKLGIVVKGKFAGGAVTTDESEFEKRVEFLKRLGFLPTFTCTPYVVGIPHGPNDVLCWTGSSGQVMSNSVFGARAGRESSVTSFAAAITGRTPYMELLMNENRYGELLVKLDKELDLVSFTEADYGALGYYIGEIAGYMPVAIEGLPLDVPLEHKKMLVSPLPVSGACTMCHMIGVTPGASTLEEAFGNRKPRETLLIGKRELRDAYDKLNDADSDQVDTVVIGCPHNTIVELGELASLLENKIVSQNVRLLIGTAQQTYTLAKEAGYADIIEKAGGITVNSCLGGWNPFNFVEDIPRITVTNSSRAAHYLQRFSIGRTKTWFGNAKQCIEAAVKGRWVH